MSFCGSHFLQITLVAFFLLTLVLLLLKIIGYNGKYSWDLTNTFMRILGFCIVVVCVTTGISIKKVCNKQPF